MTPLLPASAAPLPCGGRDVLAELKDVDRKVYEEMKSQADAIPNGAGLLWRIEADGVAPSYLFGSIHFTDPRVHDYSPVLLAALNGSRAVAVESLSVFEGPLSPGSRAATEMAKLPAGQTLDDVLPEDTRAALKKALSGRLMSYDAFKIMKPWMVMQLLSYPPCELASLVMEYPIVDKDIAQRGRDAGKPVIGLETVEEQLSALDAVSMPSQIRMLHASAVLSRQIDDMHETFVQLYLKGEVGMIDVLGQRLMGALFDQASHSEFMDNLLDKRNVNMRDRSLAEIRKGGLFITVGALHLPGEKGLVELFRKTGLKVTRVE